MDVKNAPPSRWAASRPWWAAVQALAEAGYSAMSVADPMAPNPEQFILVGKAVVTIRKRAHCRVYLNLDETSG